MMSKAAILLKRLMEGDFTHELPMAKEGVRVGTTDGVSFYLCRDDALTHVINRRLRTARGYLPVAEVMPVDDGSQSCMVCHANLSAQAAAPPMPPPSPTGGEPPNESLTDTLHAYKCINTTCPKYKATVMKPGSASKSAEIGGTKCDKCQKRMADFGLDDKRRLLKPNESLVDAVHTFKCSNSACTKYKLSVNKKGPNKNTMCLEQKCSTCQKPMSWCGVKPDASPMQKPKPNTGSL